MALISAPISTFIDWVYPKDWHLPGVPKKRKYKYSKDDTYVVIFNKYQRQEYECLFADDTFKIIFQSQPAVNTIHPIQPRNIVVIFELNDKDAAVPQV
jgi:hypothetical protein